MILCCGEALIDMIPKPTIEGPDGFVPYPGGAAFNTAIALGRLGASVGKFTGLSNDMFGEQLLTALRESQVGTDHVVFADRPTTLAFVKLTNGQADYTFMDENSAGRMLGVSDVPVLGPDVRALYFTGISLACEPCADSYANVLAQNGKGRLVMLDPNIRVGFIQDEPRYRARLEAMIARTDILKISDEDLDWFDPSQSDLADKIGALLDQGPRLIVVTRGAQGATAYRLGHDPVTVSVPKVEVVDTVGAGDTFNAGFLWALSKTGPLCPAMVTNISDEALHACLADAAKVAAITVSRAGANPPWARDLLDA